MLGETLLAVARRRRSKGGSQGVAALFACLIFIALIVTVIKQTHGLVLIPVVAIAGGVIWFKRHQRVQVERRAVEQEARWAQQQRSLAEQRRQQAAFMAEQRRQEAAAEAERQRRLAEARMRLAQELDTLLALSPTEFEHVVGQVLQGHGYTAVVHVGGAGDLGVDLRCVDPDGRSTVVQCKRYGITTKVSSPAVQLLIGAVSIADAQRGMLVTTSGFTRDAISLAAKRGIELIDGRGLVERARRDDGWNRQTSA